MLKNTKSNQRKKIELRIRFYLDGETNEKLLSQYLDDIDSLPYCRKEMITKALYTFFLPLAYQYHDFDNDKLRQVLTDVDYYWKMHFEYLKKRLNLLDYGGSCLEEPENGERLNKEERLNNHTIELNNTSVENQSRKFVDNEISATEEEQEVMEDFFNIFE